MNVEQGFPKKECNTWKLFSSLLIIKVVAAFVLVR